MKNKKIYLISTLLLTIVFVSFVYATITQISASAPANETITNQNTLDFVFTPVSDADTSFTCELFVDGNGYGRNTSVQNNTLTTITTNTSLSPGVKAWYINCTDTDGTVKEGDYVLTVDLTPPTWDQTPQNQTAEYGSAFSYDVNASDALTSVDSYKVDDTTNFKINDSGYLQNNTLLAMGDHPVNITVNDTAGNELSHVIIVSVSDGTAPTWDQTPPDTEIEFGTPFSMEVNASDPSGVDKYSLSASGFTINPTTGVITNSTGLSYGNHNLQVYVNDTEGNENSASFSLFVNDTIIPKLPNVTSASTNADGSVALSWEAVTENVNGGRETTITYRVFRTTNVGNLNTTKTANRLTTTTSTSYEDQTMTTSTAYTYVVTAVDQGGNHNGSVTAVNQVNITPAACTTNYDYGDWSVCTSGEKERTGTRTCYGGGDEETTATDDCVSRRSSSSSSTDTVSNPKVYWAWQQITPDNPGKVEFTRDDIGIKRLEIRVNNPENKVSITIEKLPGKPADVTKEITKKVYQYLDFEFNVDTRDSLIRFAVPNGWLDNESVDKEFVMLMRFNNDEWQQLNTSIVKETEDEVIYEAITPGFSYFAIAEGTQEETVVEEEEPGTNVTEEPDEEPVVEEEEQDMEETTEPVEEEGKNVNWIIVALIAGILGAAFYIFTKKTK